MEDKEKKQEESSVNEEPIEAVSDLNFDPRIAQEELEKNKGDMWKKMMLFGAVMVALGGGYWLYSHSKNSMTQAELATDQEVAPKLKQKKQEDFALEDSQEHAKELENQKKSQQDFLRQAQNSGAKISSPQENKAENELNQKIIQLKKSAQDNQHFVQDFTPSHLISISDSDLLNAYKKAFNYEQAIDAINKKIVSTKNNYVATVNAFRESPLIKKMDRKARLEIFVQFKNQTRKELLSLVLARKKLEQMQNESSARVSNNPEVEAIEAILDEALRAGTKKDTLSSTSPKDIVIEEDLIIQDSLIEGNQG